MHCACVKLRPPLTFFLVYSPPLLFQHSGSAHGKERASACRGEQQRGELRHKRHDPRGDLRPQICPL
ncbi:hypothetical protein AB205_0136060 [Aquarana catesbeiana]|uniref:Uncharacterized protein n=1 Tax=Aquarana catesbeiana TaxID=8400 RepID=A0A2G9RYR1_AQUCT|nr:hypothetical protein AB205_0136060 [Aquarana catesbeiana]